MRKKLTIAIIISILIFIVSALFAIAYLQELSALNNLKDCIPQDVFLKQQNKYLQLVLNFLMLAIGGSLLSFSIIFRGIYFKNRLFDKLFATIGLVVTFILNLFVNFNGIWTIFTGFAIIITFDCIFIFIKEEYDSLMAKKKGNLQTNEKKNISEDAT